MFPVDFPREQFERVIKNLAAEGSERTPQLVEDCYDILGYGLGVWLKGPGPVPTAPRRAFSPAHKLPQRDGDRADALRQAIAPHSLAAGASSVDWASILPIIMQLLQGWLGSHSA